VSCSNFSLREKLSLWAKSHNRYRPEGMCRKAHTGFRLIRSYETIATF